MIQALIPREDSDLVSEEEALRRIKEYVRSKESEIPASEQISLPPIDLEERIISLDALAVGNGANGTQDDWVRYWNRNLDKGIFASMPDLYGAFKQLKKIIEQNSLKERQQAEQIVVSLRDDFDQLALLSSTRTIFFEPKKETGRIVHHYGTKNFSFRQQSILPVPVYLGEPIKRSLSKKKGLRYVQALFGTEDNSETIIQTLEFISDRLCSKIKIWTPPIKKRLPCKEMRKDAHERVSYFAYSHDEENEFHVFNDGYLNGVGRSRGVSITKPNGGAP